MTREEAIKWLGYSKQGEVGKAVEALDMAIKALEQTTWIPVSERLPEVCGMYLVTEKEFAIDDRNHRGKFKVKTEQVEFHYGKWNRAKFFEVIAWQPLPEPYKKGGAE